MSFARPWLLLLLLLLPLWWYQRRRRTVPAAAYSDVSLPASVSAKRWWVALPPALRIGALAALIVAAAGPRIGGDMVEVKQEGIAIVITVLVFVYRKKTPAPSWALWTIGGLTLANVIIAVAWR